MPLVHKIHFPQHLAEQFGRGSKEKFNAYALAYCQANNPDMQIVTIKGKQQDPFEQGYILTAYKPGYSPAEMTERRNDNKKAATKKKGGKK